MPGMQKAPGRRMRAGAGRAGGDYFWMAVPVAGVCRAAEWERQATGGGKRVPGMRKAPGRGMRAGAEKWAGLDYLWMAVPDLPSRASAALCRSAMMARPPDWAKAMAA